MINTFKLTILKVDNVPLPVETRAYQDKVPIKKKQKIADMTKIIRYIPEEHRPFFEEKQTWPTVGGVEADEQVDENDGDVM